MHTTTKNKTPKQLERHFKGVANHYRIAILFYLHQHSDATLEDLVDHLKGNTKTISEHTYRLVTAGLVQKNYQSQYVAHNLSPYGKKMIQLIKSF